VVDGRSSRILLLVALAGSAPGLAGCRGAAADDRSVSSATTPPELVVFVYDRSTSIPNHTLTLARDLTDDRIDLLDHGDRIAALQVLQLSLAEPPKRWSQPVPEREWQEQEIARDSVQRVRFLKDAQDYLAAFSDTAGRSDITGTDILSTLHDVGEELRAFGDRQATLYIFSDMLQSTPAIEMEGLRRMPDEHWVRETYAKGMLPDLHGLCVVVVGARVDTEASQRVKRFWTDYFEVTGATLLDRNYTLRPVRLPENPCI
jgi:hypothetical protein